MSDIFLNVTCSCSPAGHYDPLSASLPRQNNSPALVPSDCLLCVATPPPRQVYPIGIPLLYASILWKNRHALNPPAHDTADLSSSKSKLSVLGGLPTQKTAEELEERLEMRKQNPDLVPSMFLWKDFGKRAGFACCRFARGTR